MNLPQGLEDGRTRDLLALSGEDFEISGIANRLAKINRFCGATKFPLSVATHSVAVSFLAKPEYALCGLLHDITESFGIGDMISPVKALMPGYRDLEHQILQQLTVPFPCLKDIAMISLADKRATAIEAFIHRGFWPDWSTTMGCDWPISEREQVIVTSFYKTEMSWDDSARCFMSRYAALAEYT